MNFISQLVTLRGSPWPPLHHRQPALGAGGRRSRPPHLQDSSPHPGLTISRATELAAACHMVHPRARERFPALPAQRRGILPSLLVILMSRWADGQGPWCLELQFPGSEELAYTCSPLFLNSCSQGVTVSDVYCGNYCIKENPLFPKAVL